MDPSAEDAPEDVYEERVKGALLVVGLVRDIHMLRQAITDHDSRDYDP